MFDNLRDSATPFYEEEQSDLYTETEVKPVVSRRRRNIRFLGMTAQQRFLVATMLMFMICIMGVLAMFVTGKMSLF